MTNEFTVIGEHKDNDLKLLVRGADGGYYGYDPLHEAVHPVEPDENIWNITQQAEPEDVDGPPSRAYIEAHAAP
jgi:hypothetical protein